MMIYDQNDVPMALDFMQNCGHESLITSMVHLLEQRVPFHGPPKNIEKYRKLQGEIWEFKAAQKRGPGLRIPCFRDGNNYICTHAFLKDQQKAPPREIATAKRIYEEYQQAKEAGQITIVKRGDRGYD